MQILEVAELQGLGIQWPYSKEVRYPDSLEAPAQASQKDVEEPSDVAEEDSERDTGHRLL